MSNSSLSGLQLAAALAEGVYRRNTSDFGVNAQLDLDISDPAARDPLQSLVDPDTKKFQQFNTDVGGDGVRYFYTNRGFCASVVFKNGQYWVSFRGTDSSAGFLDGIGLALGNGLSQTTPDPTRHSDVGDWVNNLSLAKGTFQNSQADDALALTRAVISQLAGNDLSKVVVAGQSLGGGLAGIIGWALDSHIEARLAVAALDMALLARNPAPGSLIHHFDRGVQSGFNRSSQRL